MDLEQLKKINTLSHELKRYGMAESSTDAFQQAQQLVTVTAKPNASNAQETVVVEAASMAPIAERQFALELERVQKALEDELEALRNAINQIISEVNLLREDFSKLQSVQPPKPKEKQVELKTETKELHPRQGNFQPGDVDIQKMFYFGTKK
jgi:hypothetical protein